MHGGKCTADSAFNGCVYSFLVKSSQDPLTTEGSNHEEILQNVRVQLEATSMHQAAEWGMRALVQSSLPCLKDRFIYEEKGERELALHSMLLLYNLRTRMVGINQIHNYYMPYLATEGNVYMSH